MNVEIPQENSGREGSVKQHETAGSTVAIRSRWSSEAAMRRTQALITIQIANCSQGIHEIRAVSGAGLITAAVMQRQRSFAMNHREFVPDGERRQAIHISEVSAMGVDAFCGWNSISRLRLHVKGKR